MMQTSRGIYSSGDASLLSGILRRSARGGIAAVAGLGASLFGVAATGQVAPETATAQLQEIVVTGSHIRRTDTETPSPVEVVTAEQLHESGFTSTQDVLHNLTAN